MNNIAANNTKVHGGKEIVAAANSHSPVSYSKPQPMKSDVWIKRKNFWKNDVLFIKEIKTHIIHMQNVGNF